MTIGFYCRHIFKAIFCNIKKNNNLKFRESAFHKSALLENYNKSERYEYARVLSFTRNRPRAHSETGSQLIYIWLYPVRHPILVVLLINGLNIRAVAIWIVNFVEPARTATIPPSSFSTLLFLFSFNYPCARSRCSSCANLNPMHTHIINDISFLICE